MHVFRFSGLILPFLLIIYSKSIAQTTDQEKYDALKTVISNKDYSFLPQSATTIKGNVNRMDPGYLVKLMTDSLIVDLPYFETGYSVNFGANDDIVKYNSKNFSYTSNTTKKGGWNITIVPKDKTNIDKIYMNITAAGYCSMRLYISNKEPITYDGTMGDNLPH